MKKTMFIGLLLSIFAFAEEKADTIEKEDLKISDFSNLDKVVLSYSNTVGLRDYYYDLSVGKLSQEILKRDAALPEGVPIIVVIDSGGGYISSGLNLMQVIGGLNRPVHTISLFAASMGFQTVQGLGDRFILETSTLMSHKAWGFLYGEYPGQLDSRYLHSLQELDYMDKRVVERTNGKLDLTSYRKLIENEYWCFGENCKKYNFIDQIISPKCDNTFPEYEIFITTAIENDYLPGLPLKIKLVFSGCPLNTQLLGYEVTCPIYDDVVIISGGILPKGKENEEDRATSRFFKRDSELSSLPPGVRTFLIEQANAIIINRSSNTKKVIYKLH